MNLPAPDLSVIIPMHNASATVPAVITAFLAVQDRAVEMIMVDDASTDDTVALVEKLADPRVRIERFASNRGAGLARNHGLALATGRYTLFFDADDEIHPDALVETIGALDDTGCDVAMLPYRYRRGTAGGSEEMNDFDTAVWRQYVTAPRRVVRLGEAPRLLGFSNYPWNKIIRTEHHRRRGLRYGSTPVHNDILGHWLTLLNAETVLLLDRPLCTHVVTAGGRNLTNRQSRARLALVDALDETYAQLAARPGQRHRYSHHYWDFVLRVSGWATSRLAPSVLDDFNVRLQEHMLRMDLSDFARIRLRRDPGLAGRITRRALA